MVWSIISKLNTALRSKFKSKVRSDLEWNLIFNFDIDLRGLSKEEVKHAVVLIEKNHELLFNDFKAALPHLNFRKDFQFDDSSLNT